MEFLELNTDDLEIVAPDNSNNTEVVTEEDAQEAIESNSSESNVEVSNQEPIANTEEKQLTEFAIIANSFKEKGLLIDEVEISDDFDYNKLESAFEKSFLKKNEDLVRQKIYEELREEGITEEVIASVKKANAGISNDDEVILEKYGALALVDLSKLPEENRESELLLWTKIKYIERGYEPEDAEIAAARDIDKDPNLAAKSNKEFFLSKYEQKKASIEQKVELAKKEKENRVKQEIEYINSILEKGEIAGEKFTSEQIKKIKRGLFEATETVKIGDNYYKVPLIKKKQIERQNNKELQLLENIYLLLDINPKKLKESSKEEGAKEVEKKFLEAMKNQGFDARKQQTNNSEHNGKVFLELDSLS